MNSQNRSFAVIGLGTFGATVARDLQRFGNDVIGIDVDERLVATHARGSGSGAHTGCPRR